MSNFANTLANLQSKFSMHTANSHIDKHNHIVVDPSDFNKLSRYELNILKVVGNIWGLFKDGQDVSYDKLVEIFNKLGRHKTDPERLYLIGMLFPERIENIHQINPFPIPTHTYKQNYLISIIPNLTGNFIAQLVCPLLCDTGTTQEYSNLYTVSALTSGIAGNTAANALDGVTLLPAAISKPTVGFNQSYLIGGTAATLYLAQNQTKMNAGMFNSGVLLFAKMSANYIGRSDVISGYLGAGLNVTSANLLGFDNSATQFDFVNKTINGTVGSLSDGMNVIYTPPDYSYLSFLPVLTGAQTAYTSNATNVRLNIYGTALPPTTVAGGPAGSIALSVTIVWNVIPSIAFADVFKLDYAVEDMTVEFQKVGQLVSQTNINTFSTTDVPKLEKLLKNPKYIIDSMVKDYKENGGVPDMSDSSAPCILDAIDELSKQVSMYVGAKDIEKLTNAKDYIIGNTTSIKEKQLEKFAEIANVGNKKNY